MDTRETAELGLWEASPQARDSNNSSPSMEVHYPGTREGRDQLSKALVLQLMVPAVTQTTATYTDPQQDH